jgi:hypothetical protein
MSVTTERVRRTNLTYPAFRSGAAKSGWVVSDNRRLNSSAESTDANVGGHPETEPGRSGGETWVASEAP